MEPWRTFFAWRVLRFVLAIHLLNISIDPPDTDPQWVAENLSVNEVESISEMILEHSLEFEDCIPEHEDHDDYHKQHHALRHLAEMIVSQASAGGTHNEPPLITKYFVFNSGNNDLFQGRISTPPPKV